MKNINTPKLFRIKISNYILILALTVVVFNCKNEEKKEDNEAIGVEESPAPSSTYAEISIAEGGEWVDGSKGHKEYIGGTSFKNVDQLTVPKEHTDHAWYIRYEGPGWENKNIGYRLYLDWRNAIDIYGKKVDSMVLPYVGQDGFDSYHEPSDWGQDILKAGKSMGIGGFGRLVNDSIVHFNVVGETKAEISNNSNESKVSIDYTDWVTAEDTINLSADLSIFPEGRETKVELTPSKEISGLVTGIVKFPEIPMMQMNSQSGEWGAIYTYGNQTLVSETDKLGMAIIYKVGEVEAVKEGEFDQLVVFKPTTSTITYYLLGAWEQEPDGIKSDEEFNSYIKDLLNNLDSDE